MRPPTRASTLTMSTDSSAALETQIEQGAPADIFLVGRHDEPAEARRQGARERQPGRPSPRNLLTVIVPTDNPGKISSPADLARPGVKVIAAGDAVPITKYATQLVMNLAEAARLPGRLRRRVRREHRLEGGQRRGGRRQGRARRGRCRDRLRHGCEGVGEGQRVAGPGRCQRRRDVRRRRREGLARIRRRRRRSCDWLAGPEGQAILTAPASGRAG